MKLKYKKAVYRLIAIGCLLLFIVLFLLLRKSETVSEYFFARGFARGYAYIAGNIASVFPFSLFDVFVTAAIIALVVSVGFCIFYLVKNRKIKAIALLERLIIAACTVALLYTGVASGNYYRKELPLEKYEGEQLPKETLAALLATLYDDFSAVSDRLERDENGVAVNPYSFSELNALIHKEYARQMTDDYFNSFIPDAKQGIYSDFLRCEGICGITFLPTGDAVINAQNPPCYNVVVTAHELAHAAGVMREGDANLVAYTLLLQSEDDYLRYCGYMYALNDLEWVLYRTDKTLYQQIYREHYPQAAALEYKNEWKEWNEKNNFLEDIGDFFNDIYLKINGATNGTESYSDASTYTPVLDNEGAVVEIKVSYSTTARVLLRIAMDKAQA